MREPMYVHVTLDSKGIVNEGKITEAQAVEVLGEEASQALAEERSEK